MGVLAVIWVVGLILYFVFTSERQRENFLLVTWIILFGAIFWPFIAWLL